MFGGYRRPPRPLALCGCWFIIPTSPYVRQYLPQVELDSSTTILTRTSRTTLTQTFTNTHGSAIPEAQYTFPLYDGASVVSFKCTIGDRTIVGVVKEKQQAQAEFKEAVDRGETAGLLEQLPEAGDVFTTKLGNVPEGGKIVVEIVYIGELKHDAETDGALFTIPTAIAPRYGSVSSTSASAFNPFTQAVNTGGIKISVDIVIQEGSAIKGLQSPSHPIAVTLGRNKGHDEDMFETHLASATLSLSGKTELDKDFIIVIKAQNQDTPCALLETHDTIVNQRALMTTLVPKFNLPNAHPEIVFVVDRSGSMQGKIPLVVQALKVFLKSLPTSVKFNICSFGSNHSFLFSKSKPYDQASLQDALSHVETFDSNYGGTEILKPLKETVKQRLGGTPLEVMMLTDGEVWNQVELFDFINGAAKEKVRVFSLGIGSGASSSLVEGMARAGNGFAQFVHDGEQIDKRVVRMLKAALTPFVADYSLEVVYDAEKDDEKDDFEIVESFTKSLTSVVGEIEKKSRNPISLFTSKFKEESPASGSAGRYDHLPPITSPKILQAPHETPQLYSFSRTTVYLLLGPESCQRPPRKVILRGTSEHGPLILEIPIQNVGKGKTIHQMAAKKAVQELEEGRGWITEAKTAKDKLLKEQFKGDWERIVEREAVRLGTQFQVAGKWCSFIAIEKHKDGNDKITTLESEKLAEPVDGASLHSVRYKKKATAGLSFARRSSGAQARGGGAFGLMSASSPAPPPPPPSGALFGAAPLASAGPPSVRTAKPAHASVFGGGAAPGASASLFGSPQQSQAATMSYGSSAVPQADMARRRNEAASFFSSTPITSAAFSPVAMHPSAPGGGSEKESAAEQDESEDEMGFMLVDDESPSAELIMHAVIGLQEFDGSWKQVDKLLLTIGGIGSDKFKGELTSASSDIVKATAVAIAWLEVKTTKEKDTWEMVADKARAWLAGQNGLNDANVLVEQAKKAFFTA